MSNNHLGAAHGSEALGGFAGGGMAWVARKPLTAAEITTAALKVLANNLTFANLVNAEYDSKIGDTLHVGKLNPFYAPVPAEILLSPLEQEEMDRLREARKGVVLHMQALRMIDGQKIDIETAIKIEHLIAVNEQLSQMCGISEAAFGAAV